MKSPVVASLTLSALLLSGAALAQDPPATDEPSDAAAAPAAAPAEAAPAAAPAEANASATAGAEPGKFVLGLRLGYALPMGSAAKNQKMSDSISGMIPIWLDVGYMVTPNIMVGIYGQYGLISMADKACPSGADCSASDLRFGVQGQYHLSPSENLDPWFGLGIGYESASWKASAGGQEMKTTYSGLEFLNLQGGADFKLSPAFGLGPFVSFSMGQYSSASVTLPGLGEVSGSITDKAMHEWLTLGVRGAFNL